MASKRDAESQSLHFIRHINNVPHCNNGSCNIRRDVCAIIKAERPLDVLIKLDISSVINK